MRQNLLALRLKELRKAKGVTQQQLAYETKLSYGSIVDYENGRRKPNAKAMVALERYFCVSGEYLLGNIDKAEFLSNSNIVQSNLDDLIIRFQTFRDAFDTSSQANQINASAVMVHVMANVTEHMLHTGAAGGIPAETVNRIISSIFKLSPTGADELAVRAEELTLLPRYQCDK